MSVHHGPHGEAVGPAWSVDCQRAARDRRYRRLGCFSAVQDSHTHRVPNAAQALVPAIIDDADQLDPHYARFGPPQLVQVVDPDVISTRSDWRRSSHQVFWRHGGGTLALRSSDESLSLQHNRSRQGALQLKTSTYRASSLSVGPRSSERSASSMPDAMLKANTSGRSVIMECPASGMTTRLPSSTPMPSR